MKRRERERERETRPRNRPTDGAAMLARQLKRGGGRNRFGTEMQPFNSRGRASEIP